MKLYIWCLFLIEFETDSRQAVQPVAGLVLAFNFVPIQLAERHRINISYRIVSYRIYYICTYIKMETRFMLQFARKLC